MITKETSQQIISFQIIRSVMKATRTEGGKENSWCGGDSLGSTSEKQGGPLGGDGI